MKRVYGQSFLSPQSLIIPKVCIYYVFLSSLLLNSENGAIIRPLTLLLQKCAIQMRLRTLWLCLCHSKWFSLRSFSVSTCLFLARSCRHWVTGNAISFVAERPNRINRHFGDRENRTVVATKEGAFTEKQTRSLNHAYYCTEYSEALII